MTTTATTKDVTIRIGDLRRQRAVAQAELDTLQSDFHDRVVSGSEADSLATQLAMSERKVEAYSREIAKLERVDLPGAARAEAAASRRTVLDAAKALHGERLDLAREIERLGAQANKSWRKLRSTEARYSELVCEAGLEFREPNKTAVAAAACAVAPDLTEDAGADLIPGEGPVALIKACAPDRLRRQTN